MEVATWCDKHNLPRPTNGEVPSETGRYLTVCMYRRPDDMPAAVLEYIIQMLGGRVAEA